MDREDIYEIIFSEEEDLSKSYEAMPPKILDIGFEFSAEVGADSIQLNYADKAIYADPSVHRKPVDELQEMIRYAVAHFQWHPDHGLAYHTDKFDSSTISGDTDIKQYNPSIGEHFLRADTRESKIRGIYREAVQDFKSIFKTEFREPELLLDKPVFEDSIEELDLEDPTVDEVSEKLDPVGYSLEAENNQIILNTEIMEELHPKLLSEDFRYILKRYHDLSLEQAMQERVIPYVEILRNENDLSARNFYFDELEKGEADYNQDKGRIRIDYSRLKDFNPEKKIFESGFKHLPGGSMMLHEAVHDLDFTNNTNTRKYGEFLGETEAGDPRNAVLEAPTTFEVFMSGWNTRSRAVRAFENPSENLDFFEGYLEEDKSGDSKTIQYPYNMGLFTALNIHEVMMERHGVERGTEETREILYDNSWDLDQMRQVLEEVMERRNVPNIPKYKRKVKEVLEEDSEALSKEASRILEEAEDQKITEYERAFWRNELIRRYEEEKPYPKPPEFEELQKTFN